MVPLPYFRCAVVLVPGVVLPPKLQSGRNPGAAVEQEAFAGARSERRASTAKKHVLRPGRKLTNSGCVECNTRLGKSNGNLAIMLCVSDCASIVNDDSLIFNRRLRSHRSCVRHRSNIVTVLSGRSVRTRTRCTQTATPPAARRAPRSTSSRRGCRLPI